jgi:hypothetical protein
LTATSLAPTADPRERFLVGALAFTEIVSWGVLYYAFGVLVGPMQAELGWSQGLLGGAFSLALLVSAFLAVPVGRTLARRGARATMTAGSCAGALLVYAWSWVESPLALYALFLALGFPLASTLYEAAFAAVIGRFGSGRRTDVALLVLTIVAGFASTVFVPLTQLLVHEHGWRGALRLLALGLAVATIPLHALVLPRAPSALTAAPAEDDGRAAPEPGRARARTLHLTGAAFALATVAGTSLGVYLVPIVLEQGFRPGFAALAGACLGIGQVIGRIGFTFLRPRYSLAAWSALLFVPAALALLLIAARPSGGVVLAVVLLFSACSGAQTLGRTAWALELFPLASFARVNGVLGRWSLVGRAVAPLAIGAAHDLAGSHGPGLVSLGVLFLGGGWCARLAARAGAQRG